MTVGLRLDLRQSQQLVMTPQLQQAIKLLQMSNLELASFVETEMEKNPLLKPEVDIPDSKLDDPEPDTRSGNSDLSEASDRRVDDHTLSADTFDTGAENLADTSPSDGPSPLLETGRLRGERGGISMEDLPSAAERIAHITSLREHLLRQIGQSHQGKDIDYLARYLVDELDEHGYLRADLADIAERLSAPEDLLELALGLLQTCEPTGVGARSLAECLRLQLDEAGFLSTSMDLLLDNLDLLARNERRKLCNICRVDETGLTALVQNLHRADPRPCAAFDTTEAQTLIPDVLLRRTSWGGWQVELNPDTLPRVLIDRTYSAELGGKACKETTQFLADCQSNASWLIKSLDQRAKTIVKIAAEIVRQQEAFFNEGITGLRPLTLRDVADAVGMHESTASRVTANKHIATDRGVLELKFFFTNAVGGGDGESDVAAEAVRHKIKAMVGAEPQDDILSDDAIVDALGRQGIQIARRTVAKYRRNLGIPSSVERRRQKAVSLHG